MHSHPPTHARAHVRKDPVRLFAAKKPSASVSFVRYPSSIVFGTKVQSTLENVTVGVTVKYFNSITPAGVRVSASICLGAGSVSFVPVGNAPVRSLSMKHDLPHDCIAVICPSSTHYDLYVCV